MEVAREEEAVVEEIAGDCLVASLLIAPVLIFVSTVSLSNLEGMDQKLKCLARLCVGSWSGLVVEILGGMKIGAFNF